MSTVDDIKQRIDIIQLVSEYVSLKKVGRNYRALCPFHSEKEPSFYVFPERQSWHCFGACNAGGDIFSFIMKKDNLEFGQALRILADKAGIILPRGDQNYSKAEHELGARLYQINELAAEYYHHTLQNSLEGHKAREYLVKRGISLKIINEFRIGFSLDNWDRIKQHLMSKGYQRGDLTTTGLLIDREDGETYDRFRNRLMFPIRDIAGHVLGFGSRVLDESLPKYMNSPQTPVFDKSSILYGIEHAKEIIKHKDQVIIVEGYMDVLISHQYGWENTVASMGTSLTDRQLSIIKRMTKNIVLALDADTAGKQATLRSEDIIEQAMDKKSMPIFKQSSGFRLEPVIDANVKVAVLSSGKDPDEIIRKNSSDWDSLIMNAIPFIDFSINTVTDKLDLNDPQEKSAAVERLLPLLSKIKDPIQLAHYRRKLAKLVRVDDKDISSALTEFQTRQRKKTPLRMKVAEDIVLEKTKIIADRLNIEEYCLALLLRYPDLRPWISQLSAEHFEKIENREILMKLKQNDDYVTITDSLDSNLHKYLENIQNKRLPTSLDESEILRQRTIDDCILRLQEKWLRNFEIKKAELLAAEAEIGGTEAEMKKLLEQGIEEHEHLKNIFYKRITNITSKGKEE